MLTYHEHAFNTDIKATTNLSDPDLIKLMKVNLFEGVKNVQ